MKKQLISGVIATAVITASIVPVSALADTNTVKDGTTAVQGTTVIKESTTTGAAVTVTQVQTTQIDFTNEYNKAQKALDSLEASNDTTKGDILNDIKGSVDSSIYIELNDFSKKDGTIESAGNITGILVLKDNSGDSKDIQVDLTIDQLKVKDTTSISEQPVENTTGAAVTEITTGPAVAIDNVVTELDTKLLGTGRVGETMKVEVTGDNAEGEKVKLDQSKLTYEWFANGKEVSEDKELTVTQDMDKEKINCTVNYPDNVEVK